MGAQTIIIFQPLPEIQPVDMHVHVHGNIPFFILTLPKDYHSLVFAKGEGRKAIFVQRN